MISYACRHQPKYRVLVNRVGQKGVLRCAHCGKEREIEFFRGPARTFCEPYEVAEPVGPWRHKP